MTSATDPSYRQERGDTFDRIIAVIDQRLKDTPFLLATDLHGLSPTSARYGAERECWQLLRSGINHLKNGAPNGEAGGIAGAVEKSAIRASAFASSMGVTPGKYEELDVASYNSFATGRDEALYMVRSLIVSVTEDLPRSKQIIGAKMAMTDVSGAFGAAPTLDDPELRAIFAAVQKSSGGPDAANDIPKDSIAAMRKQTVVSFNALLHAYAEATAALTETLDTLPANKPRPKPSAKGQSFDF
ncbi:MAG: hypothetical protein PW788_04145 [Micavibrio sp.]|nr:hypothetical protein [Micavibrio sp.]